MPTKADVFADIIAEVTGKSATEVAPIVELLRKTRPGNDRFDEEITEKEYDALLAKLRTERSGILNWAIKAGIHKPR